MTAFHLACMFGKTSIVEMMIDNATSYTLDLTAKEATGKTGFQFAKDFRETNVVNLIKRKCPSIAKKTNKKKCFR